jgi:hypothetical protein
MAIETHSKFYYGYEINTQNSKIDIDEGSGELTATLSSGIYSPGDLATEIKTQLDAIGTKTYTVIFNRNDRKFTIACDSGTFDILIASGANSGLSPYDLLGFTGVVDLTGFGTYTSDSASGSEYKTQFKLQDYTPKENWLEKVDASVNQSATGEVEVISFGDVRFIEFNLLFITNKPMDGKVIRNNASGVEDVRDFLEFAIKRGNLDFMPNENDPNTYTKVLLETTEASSKGIAYRLKEETSKNLPGFYQTGRLKWRVVS